ncbi:MAG: carboxypeptidase-like regulatory domain-containing protein [Flavobacteriales bacterium]
MQQRFLATLIFTLLSLLGFSQSGTVSGKVLDEDGEALPNVVITVKGNGTSFNTSSNVAGIFEFNIPSNTEFNIEFSSVSKINQRKTANLSDGEVLKWNIVLYDGNNKIDEVIIDGSTKVDRNVFLTQLDPKVQSKIPSVSGDITQLIVTQSLGVSVNSELGSGYNVRGGNFDENLVYVNDIEVYRPFLVRAGQQEGLSFPNPDMINSISFSAGGWEARFGDKLSSVLDITYARPDEFSGSAMASLLGASVHLQDKSKNEKLTYNTGFRYRSNRYVLGSLDTEGDYDPNYIDLQTYFTYQPKVNGAWNFDILGNYSRNRYNFVPQSRETNIGNINEALRLTIFFDGQERSQFETGFGAVSANYTPYPNKLYKFQFSAFKTQESETFDILGQYFLDELERDLGADEFGDVLRNLGVGSFLEHGRNYLDATVLTFNHKALIENENRNHKWRWGIRYQNERITDELREWVYIDSVGFSTPTSPSGQIILNDVIIGKNDVMSNRIMGHTQFEKAWSRDSISEWNFNAGVRGNYWDFTNEIVVSPRAVVSYRPNKTRLRQDSTGKEVAHKRDVLYKFAAGYYYQPPFYREMRRFDGSINTNIQAQKSIHFLTGIDYNFKSWGRDFKFIGELYYKNLAQIIPYEIDNVRIRYYADDISKGFTTGADFLVSGEFIKGVQSWIRASFLRSREDIVDDNFLEFYNSDGDLIIPGFTINDEVASTVEVDPGYIRRPTDQAFSFSMFFQDEMPKYPAWKVQVTGFYGTHLPYGPPGNSRADDILKTPSYRRVDIGLSRELFWERNKNIEKARNVKSPLTDTERNEILAKASKAKLKGGFVALEFFNLLGINNTINFTWIEAVNGRQYAIPNFLTGRRINLKFVIEF